MVLGTEAERTEPGGLRWRGAERGRGPGELELRCEVEQS